MDRRRKVELFEADPARVRVRSGHDQGSGEEARRASPDGAAGDGERDAAGAEAAGTKRARLDPVKGFIDGILEADRKAPRKQRHTAHRI